MALLQEAPPRWLGPLRRGCGADGASALTSRNSLGWLRGLAATLNPDLIASNEGGSNMVLVRSPGAIEATETVELARRPERRTMLLARVRLASGARIAVACMHLSVDSTGQGPAEVARAADRAVAFAAGRPLIFGGDLNLRPARQPEAFAELERRHGLAPPTGPHGHRPPARARPRRGRPRRTRCPRPRASSRRSPGGYCGCPTTPSSRPRFEVR